MHICNWSTLNKLMIIPRRYNMKWCSYFSSYKSHQNLYKDKNVFRTFFYSDRIQTISNFHHNSLTDHFSVDFTILFEDISSKRVDFYHTLFLKTY